MADYFMPDEMLREIAELEFPEGDPDRPASCHFDAYSDRDLLIARLQDVGSASSVRRILDWSGSPSSWPGAGQPPPVTQQLAVCLRILDCRLDILEATYGSGVLDAAQQQLTRILIQHPVLLHPYLRMYVDVAGALSDTKRTCSLAHAIALTRHARFPMARDGLSPAQLADFVNHPCVLMGLTYRQPGHRRALQRAERMTPLRAGLGQSFVRAGLVASLHGLYQVLEDCPQSGAPGGANLLLESLAGDSMVDMPHAYARIFLDAAGLHSEPKGSAGIFGQHTCPEFLDQVADADSCVREQLKPALRSIVHPAIFYRGAATPPNHVHAGVRRMVDASVVAGLFEDPEESTAWLRADLSGGLPAAGVEQAMAYLRALDEMGLPDFLAFFESEEMRHARSKPQGVPWEGAVRAYATETRMRAAIRQAGGHTGAPAAELAPTVPGPLPSAGGRRLRVNI